MMMKRVGSKVLDGDVQSAGLLLVQTMSNRCRTQSWRDLDSTYRSIPSSPFKNIKHSNIAVRLVLICLYSGRRASVMLA